MMFSTVPFSAVPFCDTAQQRRVCFDMEVSCDASFEYTIYVSTAAGYATQPTDALPSQPFRGVFQSYEFTRSILGSGIGAIQAPTGTLHIANADAFYNFLAPDYTIDAQPIRIKATRRNGPYDEASIVGELTATDWNADVNEVVIDLIDYSYKLRVPMQPNLYLGTGGSEGGADLVNKRKPLGFGSPHEISAPLVDPALLIYQVNDGSVAAITAVYDRGVSLAFVRDYATYALMAAANLSLDDGYVTCIAEGFFRLTDAAQKVTADIQGDNRDGYIDKTADIARWAIRNRTEIIDPDGLFTESFAQVNTLRPAPIEYWLSPDDDLTVEDFIANIMGGVLGWCTLRRDGLLEARAFAAPSGVPVASFDRGDMLDDLKKQPLPSSYKPPPWRWRVQYQRAYTVQTDLAASVSAARKGFLAQDVRLGGAERPAIKVDHRFATDPNPVQAYYANKADADTFGTLLINLFRTTRSLYAFTVDRRGLSLGLGDVIEVTHPLYDLVLGKLMTIVWLKDQIDPSSDQVEKISVIAYG